MPSKLLQVLATFQGEFSVKRFGARGDGTSDDTAACQAAIDAAHDAVASAGGAVVTFPPGVYVVSAPLTVREDNIALRGQLPTADNFTVGKGTILTPAANFPDGGYVLDIGDGGAKSRPLANVTLRGIGIAKLAGVTLANTVHGLRFKVYRGFVSQVFIDEMSGSGCVIAGDSEVPSWNTYETKFHNVQIRRCGGIGLHLSNNTADMHFTDCVIGGCGGAGLYVTGGASCHFVSVHSTGNLNNAHLDGGGSRSKFIGCKFESPTQHNVNLDATNGGVTDLHFAGCNFNITADLSADNTYDNLIVQRAAGGNIISGVMSGCTFQQITGANNPRYHINLSSAVASNWRIVGCKFDSNAQTGKVNHHANAVRCLVNGLGINAGDPAAGGQWNGQGEEGVRVVNTLANTLHTFANGAWRSG